MDKNYYQLKRHGEVIRGEADLIAAPITYSDTASTFAWTVNDLWYDRVDEENLVDEEDQLTDWNVRTQGHQILSCQGWSHGEFLQIQWQAVLHEHVHSKMDDTRLSRNSDGMQKIQNGDGKYVFMIDSSAVYWVNKKPCNLFSLRLGSVLDCHKYIRICHEEGFQTKLYNNNLWPRLQRAIHDLKSNGELERLKAKWRPYECSAAAAAFSITELNVLPVIITIIVRRPI